MNQDYLFTSKRLGFRFIKESDISYLEKLDGDPKARLYFPTGALNQEQIIDRIQRFIKNHQEKNTPCFMAFLLDTNEFVGRVGFGIHKSDEIEVGYILHQKFWGQGYATEALMTLLNWAKKNIDSDYIIALAMVDNVGSWRVMEKCGMEFYKTDMDQGQRCHFYRYKNR